MVIRLPPKGNPKRLTEVANDYHHKYFELNHRIQERKPVAMMNPINHEITFSSQLNL
jgi:hypothetical protein